MIKNALKDLVVRGVITADLSGIEGCLQNTRGQTIADLGYICGRIPDSNDNVEGFLVQSFGFGVN